MENNVLNENKNEEPFIEKDHKGLKTFIVIAILLLLLSGVSFFCYYKFYNNPKVVIGNILNNSKKLFKTPDKIYDISKINGSIDMDLKLENQELQKIGKVINDIKLQYNLSVNNNDKYGIFEIYSKYQDKELLNVQVALDDKNNILYLYLEDLFDKYLKMDINVEISDNINTEKINDDVIVSSIANALDEALTEDDFKREKDEVIINNIANKVYRNSLVIDNNNYKRIMTTFIEKLINNEEFIKEMDKINTNEDTKEKLQDILEEINNQNFDIVLELNFYTATNLKQELVMCELVYFENSINNTNSVTFVPMSENEFIISFIEGEEEIATISLKRNSNNNILVSLEANSDGNIIKFNFNASYEKLDKLDKLDTSKNINIEDLTNEDQSKITDNLMKNEALIKLINDISTFFSQSM